MAPRRRQIVSTLSERRKVTVWMTQQNDMTNIAARAIDHPPFRSIFRNNEIKSARNANRKKALRWWNSRDGFLTTVTSSSTRVYVSSRNGKGVNRKQFAVKVLKGRGKKRQEWVNFVYEFVIEEFDRLCEIGVKISKPMLLQIAQKSLQHETSPVDINGIESVSGKTYVQLINSEFIRRFCDQNYIVRRKMSGNKSKSLEHKIWTDRLIAYHIGVIARGFNDGTFNENTIENMDETHFVYDLDDRLVLARKGTDSTYKEVVSGGEGMTLVLRLTGGPNAKIQAPFFIFKNALGSYPINGTPDNIEGVSYRSQRAGWMDQKRFIEYLSEPRAIDVRPDLEQRNLFVDNANGHRLNEGIEEALSIINTALKKLPANTTHICQPLDQFIICEIKRIWRTAWDQKRMEMTLGSNYAAVSGNLNHPHRHWYMQLAKDCIEEVNLMVDDSGMPLVRKAMIKCGLSCDIDGVWRTEMLSEELQSICSKYPENFNGEVPVNSPDITE